MLNHDDSEAIRACLSCYIAGAVEGRSEPIRRVMHESAQIFGYLNGDLIAGPMQILYDYVDNTAPAGDTLRWSASLIDATDGAACARVTIEGWGGHNFTDYFTLLRLGGRWTIINKVFSQA